MNIVFTSKIYIFRGTYDSEPSSVRFTPTHSIPTATSECFSEGSAGNSTHDFSESITSTKNSTPYDNKENTSSLSTVNNSFEQTSETKRSGQKENKYRFGRRPLYADASKYYKSAALKHSVDVNYVQHKPIKKGNFGQLFKNLFTNH